MKTSLAIALEDLAKFISAGKKLRPSSGLVGAGVGAGVGSQNAERTLRLLLSSKRKIMPGTKVGSTVDFYSIGVQLAMRTAGMKVAGLLGSVLVPGIIGAGIGTARSPGDRAGGALRGGLMGAGAGMGMRYFGPGILQSGRTAGRALGGAQRFAGMAGVARGAGQTTRAAQAAGVQQRLLGIAKRQGMIAGKGAVLGGGLGLGGYLAGEQLAPSQPQMLPPYYQQ
jgi:hypothetical protein